METPGIGVNSDGDSIVEAFRPFDGRVSISRNVFRTGSSFRRDLGDDSDGSSDNIIRADLSLNDGGRSPRDDGFDCGVRLLYPACEDNDPGPIRDSQLESATFLRNFSVQNFVPDDCDDFESDKSLVCNFPPQPDGLTEKISSESPHHQLKIDASLREPAVSSFITMDNSNNAIDNSLRDNLSASSSLVTPSNGHVFKPPNNELTFNGTLRRLQKPHPAGDIPKGLFGRVVEAEEESTEDVPSDDVSWNSNASVSYESSKSCSTLSSSAWPFQFPAEPDRISADNRLPDYIPDSNPSPNRENTACDKILSFAGAVSPFRNITKDVNSGQIHQNGTTPLKKSFDRRESLDGSFNSGPHSPNMFSDEEECPDLKKVVTFKQFEKWDKLLMKKLEKTLQGVFPPPSVTISQLTAVQILQLYNDNLSKYNGEDKKSEPWKDAEASTSVTPPRRISCDSNAELYASSTFAAALENSCSDAGKVSLPRVDQCKKFSPNDGESEPHVSLLNMNGTESAATDDDWPDLLRCRYHGVHYNLNLHSEELDMLTCRYAARYIGCETTSSCVVVPSLSANAGGLRRRVSDLRSPGRRLSHLAQRRTAFCSAASLQTSSLHQRRQILFDRRRLAEAGRRPISISPRKRTPGKRTPNKKTPSKKTPISERKRRLTQRPPPLREEPHQPTRETSKRALFLSPEDRVMCSEPVASASVSSCRGLRSKRALFASPEAATAGGISEEAARRLRSSERDAKQGFHAKSLSFSGEKASGSIPSLTRRASEFSVRSRDLSDIQKKKLLWAVAEALRGHGVGVSDENFRRYAVPLARLTRKVCSLPQHQHALAALTASTSDTLLKIARLHVFAIMRGKTVEELFLEEQTKQLTTPIAGGARLTGYVPPSHHSSAAKNVNSENSFPEKRTFKAEGGAPKSVLQDKTVNIDVRSNSCSDLSGGIELKKAADRDRLRARRQISFDFAGGPADS